MKIYVKSRLWMENILKNIPDFYMGKNIISIYSQNSYSPFSDRWNILKLEFDDVTDDFRNDLNSNDYLFFNEDHAKQIKKFADEMNKNHEFYVHCDAGVSRSGAVGYVFNEYFNKYLEDNKDDYERFELIHKYLISPNGLVVRLLKKEMFEETDYSEIWKESTYNKDGELTI